MSVLFSQREPWLILGLVVLLLLAACTGPDTYTPEAREQVTREPSTATPADTASPTSTSKAAEQEYQIVTLLPRDAIPAIDDPKFYNSLEADLEYHPRELVVGVAIDGEARAYSIGLLSRHEIVNDTVGGHPIAITW